VGRAQAYAHARCSRRAAVPRWIEALPGSSTTLAFLHGLFTIGRATPR
jgi:hypothetical protein